MSQVCRVGYILTALLAVASVFNSFWKPSQPAKFVGLTESQVPKQFGPYRGLSVPEDVDTREGLPSADVIEREYIGPSGEVINATIIGGVGRYQLHDPRSCLVGAGWQIANDHVEYLPGTSATIPVRCCQASLVERNLYTGDKISSNTDIMYLYVINRRIVASASDIRLNLLINDLLEQTDQPVYYIRTLTACSSDTSDPALRLQEHQRLAAFTASLWNKVSPSIYQGEKS
jgi:hypothetical protein